MGEFYISFYLFRHFLSLEVETVEIIVSFSCGCVSVSVANSVCILSVINSHKIAVCLKYMLDLWS